MTAHSKVTHRTDQLRTSDFALPYRTTFPILGVPIAFETNVPTVLAVVKGAFGAWGSRAPADLVTDWTGRVRLIVGNEPESSAARAPFVYEIDEPEGCLTVTTGGSVGYADSRRGEAVARLTTTLAGDAANFQYGMIQALTLFVITGRDRYPLHAATLAADDMIVLLMGDSGAGKSTLAYALHEEGMTVLGEDVAYLSLLPTPRVWATPGPVHLVPDAARYFPRLRGVPAAMRVNGKKKIGVPARWVDPWRAPRARGVLVCLLSPGIGPAMWSPATPEDLARHLGSAPDGFNRFLNQLPGVARQLGTFPTVRVELSGDPHQGALAVLDAVRSVSARGTV